mgnify:CR=1 FL=1
MRRLLLVMVLPVALAQPSADLDKQCAAMRARAREEANAFREAGGKPGSPGDPALKWAQTFWEFRNAHPGTPAAASATRLALVWLCQADRDNEVLARAAKLSPTDPAWTSAIATVRDAARKVGRFDRFDQIAGSILRKAGDTELRAAVHAAIGQSWLDRNQPEKARAAFESAIRECPASDAARTAERKLHAFGRVAIGQPAPGFTAKTLAGAPLSLADFRGKVVYLNVWASW